MEKLQEIMAKFTEVEYDLESVLQILKELEANYEYQGLVELALNTHFIKRVLEFILVELRRNITEIDVFLMEHKEE